MKRFLATVVAGVALGVAAPVASAAPNLPPQAPTFHDVTCSYLSYSWHFRLPSYALTWFQQALAQVQQTVPGFNCVVS